MANPPLVATLVLLSRDRLTRVHRLLVVLKATDLRTPLLPLVVLIRPSSMDSPLTLGSMELLVLPVSRRILDNPERPVLLVSSRTLASLRLMVLLKELRLMVLLKEPTVSPLMAPLQVLLVLIRRSKAAVRRAGVCSMRSRLSSASKLSCKVGSRPLTVTALARSRLPSCSRRSSAPPSSVPTHANVC